MFERKILDPLEIARQAAADYAACYGEDLVSAILYGSACSQEFDPMKSDINLLIVLSEASLAMVERSGEVAVKWLNQRVKRPLFLDRAYIGRSLDVFPIEFLNLKLRYVVLAGEDVLKGIRIEKKFLGLQLERELKSRRLRLAAAWMEAGRRKSAVRALARASLNDFAAAFRALLYMKDLDIPGRKADIFTGVGRAYGLPDAPFRRIIEALETGGRRDLMEAFPAYADAFMRLEEMIDRDNAKEAL